MRIPKLVLVQIFVEELINLYSEIIDAKDKDSEGGSSITRSEIFEITIGFILGVGRRIEATLLGSNTLSQGADLKWKMIEAFAVELKNIPDEITEAKTDTSQGGSRITRQEAIAIVGEVIRDSVPNLIRVADSLDD